MHTRYCATPYAPILRLPRVDELSAHTSRTSFCRHVVLRSIRCLPQHAVAGTITSAAASAQDAIGMFLPAPLSPPRQHTRTPLCFAASTLPRVTLSLRAPLRF
jgi:hypothetical protein